MLVPLSKECILLLSFSNGCIYTGSITNGLIILVPLSNEYIYTGIIIKRIHLYQRFHYQHLCLSWYHYQADVFILVPLSNSCIYTGTIIKLIIITMVLLTNFYRIYIGSINKRNFLYWYNH